MLLVAMAVTQATPASAITTAGLVPPLSRETAVLTRQGISPARASRAIDVQSEVAETGLVSKVETALAGAYAGVWFEPATAQLHVGVTSPASRLAAEETVARAGMATDVTETPVGSTRAQLVSAQNRWNRRLAQLLARAEAQIALAPQLDAVVLTLSSSTPAQERAAIEREASVAGGVRTLVAVVPSSQLRLTTQNGPSQCKAFVAEKAYCNKTLTSGITIQSQFVGGIAKVCTAGPTARGKGAGKGKIYLLTAGHCIKNAGGNGIKWLAYTTTAEEKEIGKAVEFVNGVGTSCASECGDFGAIVLESQYWEEAGSSTPVFAGTAEWGAAEPLKAYEVKRQEKPVVGVTNCHEGQTSGQSCGQIKAENVTTTISGIVYEGLVEDKGANGRGGDSGGPWMIIEKTGETLMEGTLAGGPEGNGVTLYYEPLKTIFGKLSTEMELLTRLNEYRCP
jgi:streptogrisin C